MAASQDFERWINRETFLLLGVDLLRRGALIELVQGDRQVFSRFVPPANAVLCRQPTPFCAASRRRFCRQPTPFVPPADAICAASRRHLCRQLTPLLAVLQPTEVDELELKAIAQLLELCKVQPAPPPAAALDTHAHTHCWCRPTAALDTHTHTLLVPARPSVGGAGTPRTPAPTSNFAAAHSKCVHKCEHGRARLGGRWAQMWSAGDCVFCVAAPRVMAYSRTPYG